MTTEILAPVPVQKFFDGNGAPLSGGKLFTYIAGTTTKQGTFSDSVGTPNTNPVILNARGEAPVWLDPTLIYKWVLSPANDTDPPTNPIWTSDNINSLMTSSTIGQLIWPQSPAEAIAGVTPTFYNYPWGDIRRYGAVINVDCTAILNTAATCNAEVVFPAAPASWLISTFPSIPNNVVLTAAPGALFSGTGATQLGFYTASAGFNGIFYERMKVGGVATTAGSGATGPIVYNITSDTVDTTTSSNGNFRLLNLIHGVSAGHTGGRSGIYSLVSIVGTPGLSPAGQPGYVSFEGLTQCSVNLTGTAGAYANYQGGIYGANPWARTVNGATFLHNVTSQECDISVAYGSSTARKNIMTFNKTVADYLKGDYDDTCVVFADQGGLSNAAAAIPVTAFIAGRAFKIQTAGTPAFTLIGSPNNTVGTIFACTGPGVGTGTGVPDVPPWTYGIGFGSYADGQWVFDATSSIIYGQPRVQGIPGALNVVCIEQNRAYKIAAVGSTDLAHWQALGSPNNTVGTIFIAARAGQSTDGSGTVTRGYPVANIGVDFTAVLFKTGAFASPGFNVSPVGDITTPAVLLTGKVVVNNNAVTPYVIPANTTYVGFTGTQLATLQFTFPAGGASIDGYKITIFTAAAVGTAATWVSAGATFVGAPATLAANSVTAFIYDQGSTQWLRT